MVINMAIPCDFLGTEHTGFTLDWGMFFLVSFLLLNQYQKWLSNK